MYHSRHESFFMGGTPDKSPEVCGDCLRKMLDEAVKKLVSSRHVISRFSPFPFGDAIDAHRE
jgi:hypothetical protein